MTDRYPDPRPRLVKLTKGSQVWTATIVDGNLTYTAPTAFFASTPFDEVLRQIKARSPRFVIEVAA